MTIGLLCPVLAVASWRRLRSMDRSIGVRDGDIEMLHGMDMFSALPLPAVEQLARGLGSKVPAGETVFRQGDAGDRYFVIESGEVEVIGDGQVITRLGAGQGFGEIALLRHVRRTATVRTTLRRGSRPCGPSTSSRSCWATRPVRATRGARSTRCSTGSHLSAATRRTIMATESTLLLIADIGGYTEYLRSHRMSLAHVQVNTARLLERVIDAAPGYDLVEIEGGTRPSSPARSTPFRRARRCRPRSPSRPRCTGPSTSSGSTSRRTCAPATGASSTGNLKLKFVGTSVTWPRRPSASAGSWSGSTSSTSTAC